MQQLHNKSLFKPKVSLNFTPTGLLVEIESEHLYIHSYREEHFENCVLLYGDQNLSKYFDHGAARSRDETLHLVNERGLKYFTKNKPFGLFSMFDKLNMSFIGQIDLVPTNEPGTLELGCILHKKYHNQGFPMEAGRALTIDYIRTLNKTNSGHLEFPIKKVIATAHPKNYASQRLLRYLGMTFDGVQERFGVPRLWYSCDPSLLSY